MQTTKQGFVFVLDRDTGKPVFPVEEVPAPRLGRARRGHQPYLPAAQAARALRASTTRPPTTLTTRTPEASRWAREQFAQMRSDGPFKPLSIGVDTTIYPGFDGGAEWGGPAWDPDTGLLYVNANEMAWLGSLAANDTGRSTGKSIYLRECAACHGDSLQGSPPQFPSLVGLSTAHDTRGQFTDFVRKGGGRMPAFPACRTRRSRAIAQVPVRRRGHSRGRARYARRSTSRIASPVTGAGSTRRAIPRWACPGARSTPSNSRPANTRGAFRSANFPSSRREGIKDTGSENYGGPLVTSGGLLFIGASIHDRKFRAFDKRTGKLLWEAALPYSADATPITYQVDGRQYVAIFASGGKERGGSDGGVYLAYALPGQLKPQSRGDEVQRH